MNETMDLDSGKSRLAGEGEFFNFGWVQWMAAMTS